MTMGSRIKEDERIEKAIRSLLKLPENRRCVNCNSLGPQYVCTTFWTFVCTNCSGIHREFTHRVKSVSMAKFTTEEVNALQAGGNERARQIYFKEWDPQRNAYPESSNLYRLRNFIKNVYVDRKYSGESIVKLSRSRSTDTDDLYESKKIGAYSFGSRSPNNRDGSERSSNERNSAIAKNDDRSFKFYYNEKRSPRHARQSSRSNGLQKSPIHFEVVDDRFRDEGGVWRYDSRNFSNWRFKGSKSLVLSSDRDRSSLPVIRSIRDVLGDNASRLQVGSVPKVEERKDGDVHALNQMEASSSNQQKSDKTTVEQRRANPESLIDLVSDPEPSDPAAAPKAEKITPSMDPGSQSSNELDSADKAPQVPDANSLEALLFGLSVPLVGTEVNNFEAPSNNDTSSTASAGKNPATLEVQMSTAPNNIDAFTTSTTSMPAQSFKESSSLSSFPAADDSFNARRNAATAVIPNNQQWMVSTSSTPQEPLGVSGEQSSQDVSKPAQITLLGEGTEPHQTETKSNERKELPEDLFTGSHSFAPPQFHGWQSDLHHHMGYSMQYYPDQETMGGFAYSAKPTNPFDLSSETDPIETPQFPFMAQMQGALPNVSAQSGFSHSSGLMAPQSPLHATAMTPMSPSFSSAASPGAYRMQKVHMKMQSPRAQGFGGFSIDGISFDSSNTMHQASSGCPAPANLNSYSSRGNPFD